MHVGKTNGGGPSLGKEVREARKQEDEEQVEVQERPEVQGIPGGLDAVADDACADGGRGRRLSPLPCSS